MMGVSHAVTDAGFRFLASIVLHSMLKVTILAKSARVGHVISTML